MNQSIVYGKPVNDLIAEVNALTRRLDDLEQAARLNCFRVVKCKVCDRVLHDPKGRTVTAGAIVYVAGGKEYPVCPDHVGQPQEDDFGETDAETDANMVTMARWLMAFGRGKKRPWTYLWGLPDVLATMKRLEG